MGQSIAGITRFVFPDRDGGHRSKFDRLFLEEGLAELNSSQRTDRGPAKTCTSHAVSCTIGIGIRAGIDARFPDHVIRDGECRSDVIPTDIVNLFEADIAVS
jgi:hypothetical protein